MQDPYGLMNLLGGREATVRKLDTMLDMGTDYKPGSYGGTIHEMRETVAAKMGQYAHVNEPCHHVLYFYDYAGQPWKTQWNVRRVLDELYGPEGMVRGRGHRADVGVVRVQCHRVLLLLPR